MNRRISVRHPRRVQVAFWKQGDPAHGYTGYTSNMSVSGMFICTTTPLARGSRLRIEVLDNERGFIVEGVVTHGMKTPIQLQAFRQSGMGVRMLKVEELIANYLDGGVRQQQAMSSQAQMSSVAQAQRQPPVPQPPQPAPVKAPAPPVPGLPAERVFTVHFTAPEQFLVAYRREMQNGGLFVPAEEPAAQRERVLVRIHLPREDMAPVLLPACVVQTYAAHLNHGVGGMAVEFENPSIAAEKLDSVFAILRNTA
jgi:Tfp pilus assembly protein PilZ